MTLAEALQIVDLDTIKLELRIADSETAHDSLLTGQIHDAANFVQQMTGAKLANVPRLAVIAAVRGAASFCGPHTGSNNKGRAVNAGRLDFRPSFRHTLRCNFKNRGGVHERKQSQREPTAADGSQARAESSALTKARQASH